MLLLFHHGRLIELERYRITPVVGCLDIVLHVVVALGAEASLGLRLLCVKVVEGETEPGRFIWIECGAAYRRDWSHFNWVNWAVQLCHVVVGLNVGGNRCGHVDWSLLLLLLLYIVELQILRR